MTNFAKRFSIAHYDRFDGDFASTYYQLLKNADKTFLSNIHDVYFGKFFYYNYNGVEKRCGNAMGVEASDEQVDYLFKIQEELGIEISLTFNTVEIPHEVVFDPNIRHQFVEWIGQYYDRGLRSCTMSSSHIMRCGELQERCPDMRWKSTVNQIVADAQQLIDYAYLGYNTILLDRSLNRNIRELKRIRKAQNYLNSKNPRKKLLTSLLVSESCIYNCPFKKEHDSVGEVISVGYFRGPADITCNGWRGSTAFKQLPRAGIDLIASTPETLQRYMNLVDIFKHSGRLTNPVFTPQDVKHMKAVWFYSPSERFNQPVVGGHQTVYADSFEEIVDNNLQPLHAWIPGWIDTRFVAANYKSSFTPYSGIWSTEEGKTLEKLLTTCRNQCWDCHMCERTFGTEDIDSALQIRKVMA